jgi:CubicO group peptidase (beta-lactamase class C family)
VPSSSHFPPLLLTCCLAFAVAVGVAWAGAPASAAQSADCDGITTGSASLPPALQTDAVRAALDGIAATVEAARTRGNVPAVSVAVVYGQQVIYAAGFGCADVAAGAPATADTIYRIGSVTKLFTDTMLMQLRDAGLLNLDDPVDRYVPAVTYKLANGDTVSPTFRQLASHTAGLPRMLNPPPATVAELFERLHHTVAQSAPGTRFSYSNLGVAVLGQALAIIAGQPYAEYITEHILEPLGMTSSGFQAARLPQQDLAVGYRAARRTPSGALNATPISAGTGSGVPSPMSPAGALWSSVRDLMRFAALQFRDRPAVGDQVLAPDALRQMWDPVLRSGPRSSVGIGWFITEIAGQRVVMHNGSVDGFRADFKVVPELKLGVAVLYNLRPPRTAPFIGPERIGAATLAALIPAVEAAQPPEPADGGATSAPVTQPDTRREASLRYTALDVMSAIRGTQ